MRITAKEEYGLRCILQLASAPPGEPLSAAEIARREGLSCPYVEKLLWTLKKAGFTKSHRGVKGGYVLARPPEQISLGDVERALGGLWTTEDICDRYTGQRRTCIHDKDCSPASGLEGHHAIRCGGDGRHSNLPDPGQGNTGRIVVGKNISPACSGLGRTNYFLGAKYERFVRFDASDVGSATALNLERRYHGH